MVTFSIKFGNVPRQTQALRAWIRKHFLASCWQLHCAVTSPLRSFTATVGCAMGLSQGVYSQMAMFNPFHRKNYGKMMINWYNMIQRKNLGESMFSPILCSLDLTWLSLELSVAGFFQFRTILSHFPESCCFSRMLRYSWNVSKPSDKCKPLKKCWSPVWLSNRRKTYCKIKKYGDITGLLIVKRNTWNVHTMDLLVLSREWGRGLIVNSHSVYSSLWIIPQFPTNHQ